MRLMVPIPFAESFVAVIVESLFQCQCFHMAVTEAQVDAIGMSPTCRTIRFGAKPQEIWIINSRDSLKDGDPFVQPLLDSAKTIPKGDHIRGHYNVTLLCKHIRCLTNSSRAQIAACITGNVKTVRDLFPNVSVGGCL